MTGTKRSASDSVAEEKAPAEKKKKENEKQEIAPLTSSLSSSSSSASSETITTLSTKNESAPTWFQKDRIHAYEIEFCPHFFSHTRLTKTPALYQMIRNEIISILLLIGGLSFWQWRNKSSDGRLKSDRWLLRLPLAGNIIRDINLSKSFATLHLLLKNDIRLNPKCTASECKFRL